MAQREPEERSHAETDEMQKARFEIAGLQKALNLKQQELEQYQSKAKKEEENFHTQRRTWQRELAEKQLLLQGRNAEIEQSKSESASLRKRIRELESGAKQPPGSTGSDPDPEQSFHAPRHLDTHPETTSVENEKKSSRIFGARRWRTREQKRRWQS
jgi:hypothetical protein